MKINLKKEFFTQREFVIAEHKNMKATAFTFTTGVAGLKIENTKGNFVILPFQGQQIWSAEFNGYSYGMKTMIKEPRANVSYLETYGGFLYHCGCDSVGAPDSEHPQHGIIPNAEYSEAYLICDEDDNGAYMAVGGTFEKNVSFVKRYQFRPVCKLYEDATVLNFDIELENMRDNPMEYAYLCHINFAPVDGAKLICNAELKTVHRAIPDDMPEDKKAKLISCMDSLEADSSFGDIVGGDGQFYEPEICCTYMYKGDMGYTLQYTEGEGAFYAAHGTKELPYAIRWISRTATEDSMGMVLPCTCEHLGYSYAKENGQIKTLPPFGKISFSIEAGRIDDTKAKEVIAKI